MRPQLLLRRNAANVLRCAPQAGLVARRPLRQRGPVIRAALPPSGPADGSDPAASTSTKTQDAGQGYSIDSNGSAAPHDQAAAGSNALSLPQQQQQQQSEGAPSSSSSPAAAAAAAAVANGAQPDEPKSSGIPHRWRLVAMMAGECDLRGPHGKATARRCALQQQQHAAATGRQTTQRVPPSLPKPACLSTTTNTTTNTTP